MSIEKEDGGAADSRSETAVPASFAMTITFQPGGSFTYDPFGGPGPSGVSFHLLGQTPTSLLSRH